MRSFLFEIIIHHHICNQHEKEITTKSDSVHEQFFSEISEVFPICRIINPKNLNSFQDFLERRFENENNHV